MNRVPDLDQRAQLGACDAGPQSPDAEHAAPGRVVACASDINVGLGRDCRSARALREHLPEACAHASATRTGCRTSDGLEETAGLIPRDGHEYRHGIANRLQRRTRLRPRPAIWIRPGDVVVNCGANVGP